MNINIECELESKNHNYGSNKLRLSSTNDDKTIELQINSQSIVVGVKEIMDAISAINNAVKSVNYSENKPSLTYPPGTR